MRILILFFGIVFFLCADSHAQKPGNKEANVWETIMQAQNNLPANTGLADSLLNLVMEDIFMMEVDSLMAHFFKVSADLNFYRSKYFLSIEFYHKSLNNDYASDNANFTNQIFKRLGEAYYYTDQKEKAVESFEKNKLYAEKSGDSVLLYDAYVNIGAIYSKIRDFAQSDYYLEKALIYFQNINDSINIATAYDNLAINAYQRGDIETAMELFDTTIDIYRKTKNDFKLLSSLINRVYISLDRNIIENVPELLNEAGMINQRLKNEFFTAAINFTNGLYYLLQKSYPEAEDNFLKAAIFYEENGDNERLYTVYSHLINIYFNLNDFEKHQHYLDEYQKSIVKAFQTESANKIAEYRTIYETDLKNTQIVNLNILLKQKNKIILLWMVVSLLMLVSTVIVIIFYFRLRKEQSKLFEQNIEMSKILTQDEVTMYVNEDNIQIPTELSTAIRLFNRMKEEIVMKKLYFDPDLRVVDLATLLYTNEKYISQAITAGGYSNFNKFINQYRINEAKRILSGSEFGRLTYDQIASRVGFSNQFTFIRNFKEMTGLTPHLYRKMAFDK
jgi:AraC-like DNA-binding protein